jgi:hypothetical protein
VIITVIPHLSPERHATIKDQLRLSGIASWVGPESKTFAARNNRLTIIEGGELKHLLAEYLHIDVRIDFPQKPPKR